MLIMFEKISKKTKTNKRNMTSYSGIRTAPARPSFTTILDRTSVRGGPTF